MKGKGQHAMINFYLSLILVEHITSNRAKWGVTGRGKHAVFNFYLHLSFRGDLNIKSQKNGG